jgi:hypothetical protein
MPDLTLRPTWPEPPRVRTVADFTVFDGDRNVGRIHRTNSAQEEWFWGVRLVVANEPMRGYAPSLEEARTAFKAAYEASSTPAPPVNDRG